MDCKYCYLSKCKREIFMSKDVLDELIFKHLNSQELDYVEFVWHGGEPLLHEDSFFDYIAKKQKEFNRFGTKIVNKIQTNGLFLTKERFNYLRARDFFVGVSLDGCKEVHDGARVTTDGEPTFETITGNLDDICDTSIGLVATLTTLMTGHESESYSVFKRYSKNVKLNFYCPTTAIEGAEDSLFLDNDSATQIMLNFYRLLKQDTNAIKIQPFTKIINSFVTGRNTMCQYNLKACCNVIAIDPSGVIYPCGKATGKEMRSLAQISDLCSITDIFQFNKINEFIESRTALIKDCCKYASICNAGCPQESLNVKGDEFEKTYYCPTRMRLFSEIEKDLRRSD
ncbi:MAG: radical SAM protein [Nanoarchaeota archaeon]